MVNVKELAARVATANDIYKKDAENVIRTALEEIVKAMKAGEEVSLNQFGKFYTDDIPEKTGIINFGERKGQQYVVAAHKAPKFKFASSVKTTIAE